MINKAKLFTEFLIRQGRLASKYKEKEKLTLKDIVHEIESFCADTIGKDFDDIEVISKNLSDKEKTDLAQKIKELADTKITGGV